MSDAPHSTFRRCALTGCAESIEQPADGGPARLYCSHEHRAAARRLRSIARIETQARSSRVAITPTTTPTWLTDPFSLPPDRLRRGG